MATKRKNEKVYPIYSTSPRPRFLVGKAAAMLSIQAGRQITHAEAVEAAVKTWEEVQRLPASLPELVKAWNKTTKPE